MARLDREDCVVLPATDRPRRKRCLRRERVRRQEDRCPGSREATRRAAVRHRIRMRRSRGRGTTRRHWPPRNVTTLAKAAPRLRGFDLSYPTAPTNRFITSYDDRGLL